MSQVQDSTGNATRRIAASLVVLCGLVSSAAAAGGVCDGIISAQALRPLPADTAFDVDIYDNSDANIALRDRFLEALRKAGRPVAQGGPLMISVVSERLFPNFRPDTRAVGTPTTRATTDQLGVNRTRSTIENLRPAPQHRSVGPNRRYEEQIDVRFELRDSTTRQFVWLGQITCTPQTDNRNLIVDAVFDAFISHVGATVKNAPL